MENNDAMESSGLVMPENASAEDVTRLVDHLYSGANINDFQFTEPAQPTETENQKAEQANPPASHEVSPPEVTPPEQTAQPEPFKVYNSKEDYQKDFDEAIGKRLEGQRHIADDYNKIKPQYDSIIDDLTKLYNTTPENAARMLRDDYIKSQAQQREIPEDVVRAQVEAENQRRYYEQQTTQLLAQSQQQAFIGDIMRQANEFTAKNPGFNMDNEAQNQKFVDCIVNKKLSVEDAYNLCHLDEITKNAATQAQRAVVQSVATNQMSVSETALIRGAPGGRVAKTHWSNAELDDIEKRALAGEVIRLE